MRGFASFYFMKNEPEKIGKHIASHAEHRKDSALPDYLGGPFTDRSGGLVSFSAKSLEAAESLIRDNPLVTGDLVAQKWLKEWSVQ